MSLNRLTKTLALAFLLICSAGCDSEDDGNRVLIGNSNVIFELGNLQYQEQFAIQVSDPNGAPSPNTSVTIKLNPLTYSKGRYVETDIDTPPDGTPDRWAANVTVVCASEDSNGNGALDAGEDINNNGILEPDVPTLTAHPDKSPTLTPGSNSVITDDNGFGYFSITYPKSEASWSSVQVTVEANDGLAGNTASYRLDLRALVKDLSDLTIDPPSGGPSPYGTAADCTDPS